jgi:predicted DNA-binding transcriptional regulator YafY
MLRVSTRSVRRYLRELALVTEIESTVSKPGDPHVWRIKPTERGRAVVLRRTQACALLGVRRVFDVLKGSVLFDEIDVAFQQIDAVAQRPPVRPVARGDVSPGVQLGERFAFAPALSRGYSGRSEDIDEAFEAVIQLVSLRFRYRGRADYPRTAPTDPRVAIQPYALVLHEGTMTCVGRDMETGVVRVSSRRARTSISNCPTTSP